MKPTTPILLAALAAIPLLAGCGNERRDEPLTEPLTTNDPSITLGHRVFSQHCNQCHPGGAAGLAPAINNKPLPVNLSCCRCSRRSRWRLARLYPSTPASRRHRNDLAPPSPGPREPRA